MPAALSSPGNKMDLRHIDWIWNVSGAVALLPGQSPDEAFDRLEPLFDEVGTSHVRTSDELTFHKKDAAAQDKLSVFDKGVLRIEPGADGLVLHYRLASRALLLCFLAPLLFLAIAQLTIAVDSLQPPPTAAEQAAKKAAAAKKASRQLNPIDSFLGAPAPDKPDAKKAKEKDKEKDKKRSPTPAYVFAGIFATLYVAGRILEAWLVKTLFRKRLGSL
jgi:hypothetical protein